MKAKLNQAKKRMAKFGGKDEILIRFSWGDEPIYYRGQRYSEAEFRKSFPDYQADRTIDLSWGTGDLSGGKAGEE